MDGSNFDRLTRLVTEGRTRRSTLGLLAAGLALGAGEVAARERHGKPQSREANPGKTTICHYDKDDKTYYKITVADRALPAHMNHGDYKFGNCCYNVECTGTSDTCTSGTCTCGADKACGVTETCTGGACICNTPATGDEACSGQQACNETDSCTTLQPIEGGACFCHQGSPCDAVSACTDTSECPEGWVCANSCCGDLRCLPPCGTVAAGAAGRSAGRMSINR